MFVRFKQTLKLNVFAKQILHYDYKLTRAVRKITSIIGQSKMTSEDSAYRQDVDVSLVVFKIKTEVTLQVVPPNNRYNSSMNNANSYVS